MPDMFLHSFDPLRPFEVLAAFSWAEKPCRYPPGTSLYTAEALHHRYLGDFVRILTSLANAC